MAKGQKKSNRETRKPKQEKAKPAPDGGRSFLEPATRGLTKSMSTPGKR